MEVGVLVRALPWAQGDIRDVGVPVRILQWAVCRDRSWRGGGVLVRIRPCIQGEIRGVVSQVAYFHGQYTGKDQGGWCPREDTSMGNT